MRQGRWPWLSTMATNLAIAVVAAVMIRLVGIGPFLLVHLPITLLAGDGLRCPKNSFDLIPVATALYSRTPKGSEAL